MKKFLRSRSISLPGWLPHRRVKTIVQHPVGMIGAVVSGLLLLGQSLGMLQPLELAVLDQMVRLQPDRGTDPRLLVVTITEADIRAQKQWPLSDQTIAQLLKTLQQYQPRVIGLDLFRDLPKEPGREELLQQLQEQNVIAIKKLRTEDELGVSPPPTVDADRIGFNDVVVDPDGLIRRNLISVYDSGTLYSFAFQVVRHYFPERDFPAPTDLFSSDFFRWGRSTFYPMDSTSGAYQGVDSTGYQVLLNYRSRKVAREVTLTQVLNQSIEPEWVRGKIVLIGATAASAKDLFPTPYSATEHQRPRMPGVMLHAQMVSQLLDAVAGDRSLFWFWTDWAEIGWLVVWSLAGGSIVWYFRHPLRWSLIESGAILVLLSSSFWLWTQAGWVPVVAPFLGLVLSSAGVLSYLNYQAQKERQMIGRQAQEQEKTIALLRVLISETPSPSEFPPAVEPQSFYDMTMAPVEAEPGDSDDIFEQTTDPQEAPKSVPIDTRKTIQNKPGKLLAGRYQMLKTLGYGGFGLTSLAEDRQRPGNPICVVKHLFPARHDAKFLQTARRLFQAEAEIMERLGRHEQIPQLLASFEEQENFYLVQEFIEGQTLNDELSNKQRFAEAEVINLLQDVLEVLAFVHGFHVIHRDIKPSNLIRRRQDNRIVVIDFGAVKQMQPQVRLEEGSTVAIGTKGYAPPEQLAGHPSLNSDIYSLGMIAIQALTGLFPQQLQQNPENGCVIWRPFAQVSDELATVIDGMVRYYFCDRYQSAIEVLQHLKRLSEMLPGNTLLQDSRSKDS